MEIELISNDLISDERLYRWNGHLIEVKPYSTGKKKWMARTEKLEHRAAFGFTARLAVQNAIWLLQNPE